MRLRRRSGLLLTVLVSLGCARAEAPRETEPSAPGPASPAAIPIAISRPPALPRPIRVLVGGDLIPHRPALAQPSAVVAALAPLAPLFRQADSVIANYEAATGELDKRAFRLAYAAPPEWLEALPETGIRAVTVANNHACDLDYDGVQATLGAAKKSGLLALGGDDKEPWAPRVVAERDGKKVCAVAWTTLINAPGGCKKTVRLAVADESAAGRRQVAAALANAQRSCDATIAVIHGGDEYAPQTNAVIGLAKQAADSGADAVIVHHPHIASPVIVHGARDGRMVPIFASVGNLVSNQGESWKPPMFPVQRQNRRLVCVNGWTRLGVLADLAFDLTGEAPRLDWSYHLLWTDNSHADDKAAAAKIETRLLDPSTDGEIITRLADDEAGPLDLFDDPCWVERPVYTEGDRERSPRCGTTLVKSAAPIVARAHRRKKH